MKSHQMCKLIVDAVSTGLLAEPLSPDDIAKVIPTFRGGTHNAFPWKHRLGNLGHNSELFIKVSPGKLVLKRPIKYDLDL